MVVNKLIEVLVRNNCIEKEEMDEYAESLRNIIGKSSIYIGIFGIALLSNTLIPTLFYLIFFQQLRVRTGGYHAKTRFGCFCGTILIYVTCMGVVSKLIEKYMLIEIVILVIAVVVIILFAPVNHPNLELNSEEIRLCRKSSRRVLLIELIYILVTKYLRMNVRIEIYAIMGIATCAVLIILAKCLKQEVNVDD